MASHPFLHGSHAAAPDRATHFAPLRSSGVTQALVCTKTTSGFLKLRALQAGHLAFLPSVAENIPRACALFLIYSYPFLLSSNPKKLLITVSTSLALSVSISSARNSFAPGKPET